MATGDQGVLRSVKQRQCITNVFTWIQICFEVISNVFTLIQICFKVITNVFTWIQICF